MEEISESYLFKDVFQLTTVKYTAKIRDLLRLLAFQVGQQVSVHELTRKFAINRETVERYIDLLEKAFVIFRLPAFSRNLRNEVSKMEKNKLRIPKAWKEEYGGDFRLINRSNYFDFIMKGFFIPDSQ